MRLAIEGRVTRNGEERNFLVIHSENAQERIDIIRIWGRVAQSGVEVQDVIPGGIALRLHENRY